MHNRILTLLCAAGLAFSAPAFAASVQVRSDAPTRYVVKQGDTLWGISGKFLHKPWQWNRLWGGNRATIRNPHRIYPGQVLVLRYVNGKPRLGFEGASSGQAGGIPVTKLRPHVREISQGYGIQTLNVDFFRMFMQHPQVIPAKQTQYAPRLIEGPDNRSLYVRGDRVYTLGITEPGRYLVYRVRKDVTDPETKKFLGQEVVFSGIVATLGLSNTALDNRSMQDAKTLPDDEYYTRPHPLLKVPTQTAQPLVVEEAVSEIRKGDFLLKLDENQNSFYMEPHAPSQHVNAKVVSIFDGIAEAGQFQTITLNKGSLDGLAKGTVLSLYKRDRKTRVVLDGVGDKARSTVKYVAIPAEEVGLAMVYRVSDNLASAIILNATQNISVGDTASEPGHDLDNMGGDDGRHVPNDAQESHSHGEGSYNMHSNIDNGNTGLRNSNQSNVPVEYVD